LYSGLKPFQSVRLKKKEYTSGTMTITKYNVRGMARNPIRHSRCERATEESPWTVRVRGMPVGDVDDKGRGMVPALIGCEDAGR
jgi:hypothetical protein